MCKVYNTNVFFYDNLLEFSNNQAFIIANFMLLVFPSEHS